MVTVPVVWGKATLPTIAVLDEHVQETFTHG